MKTLAGNSQWDFFYFTYSHEIKIMWHLHNYSEPLEVHSLRQSRVNMGHVNKIRLEMKTEIAFSPPFFVQMLIKKFKSLWT